MAGADIALRVSTTGADEARAKLALVGETGTQALTRINAASSEASGGIEARREPRADHFTRQTSRPSFRASTARSARHSRPSDGARHR
jgi:hypothetical protein